MGKGKVFGALIRRTEGSVAVISALGLVAFLGMVSLAIDMGQLYTVRNELQNVADAAALAAAGNLIHDYGAGAVRDAAAAQQAAMTVAQRQSQLSGQTAVENADRDDLTIMFGAWDIKAGNPATAWTEIGPTCASNSTANAVKVTFIRAAGTVYGPVSNFFGGVLGINTSRVAATAIAYLGYTTSTPPGAVTVPLALPDTVLTAAKRGQGRWWASLSLLAPKEAVASVVNDTTFKDLGSNTFYSNHLGKPLFDIEKAYLFVVNSSDPNPTTVINNLKKNYTTGTPVRAIERGSRLYPISEYQWASNIKTIFSAFKNAYNAKKDSSTGKWRVTVPIYSTQNPLARRLQKGLNYLARLLAPVSQAHACFNFWTQTYPGGNVPIYVEGFANVDITEVTYNSGCDDCSPYAPAADGKSYLSTVDCMVNSAQSCRNTNVVTIEVPVDSSTVSPPGTTSGGPSNEAMNPEAPANTGAFASIPRLVK
jgi:Flp pilus assembly protein TadG